MKIGLLSDTHGHLARSHAAIQCLLEQGVECLIHCGDIGSEQILIELAADCHADRIPVYAVTGNVDLHRADIIDFPESTGVHVARAHTIRLAGKRVGIVHGDDGRAMREMIDSGTCDLVFTGHTHRVSDEQVRGVRVINPGAVYPAAQATVATFNTETDTLGIHPLDLR
ncbi:MAG: YfcE family phosphodiesterase [Verrucomicrobiota bacterium]